MPHNKMILIGGIAILALGSVNAAVHKRPETPVLAGGIGVIVLASLLEVMGEKPARLAQALVGLAVLTVFFVEAPAVFQALSQSQKGKK